MIKQFVARQLLPEYANDPTAQLDRTRQQTVIEYPPNDIHMRHPGRYRMYSVEDGGRGNALGKGWAQIVCSHTGRPLVPHKPIKDKGHAGFFGDALTEIFADMRGNEWRIMIYEFLIGSDDGRVTRDVWIYPLTGAEKIEDKLPERLVRYLPAILAAQSKAQCVECGRNGHKAHYTVYEAPVGKEVAG